MSDRVDNAKEAPRIFYGLHMLEGTAEYRPAGQDPYRILIRENALKDMDATFSGRPVYVRHVDNVNMDNIQGEAQGYVIESFFNPPDGKHWAKFIVVGDAAHEAIRNGWVLSNSYTPKELGPGGLCNGVEYSKEITKGVYDHLAIVPDPRYEQSKILTPEEFKEYNEAKLSELKRLSNELETEPDKGDSSMFELFTRKKVENSAAKELENTVIVLPKSKIEISIAQLANEMDDYKLEMKLPKMANDEDMVDMDNEKVSVAELKDCYGEMKKNKKNAEEAAKKAEEEKKANEAKEMEEKENDGEGDASQDAYQKQKNEEDEKKKKAEEEKKANEAKAMEEEKSKQNALELETFEKLKNAGALPPQNLAAPVNLSGDSVGRGRVRYGSN